MSKAAFDFTGKQSQTTSNDFHQVLMYLIKEQSRVARLYLATLKLGLNHPCIFTRRTNVQQQDATELFLRLQTASVVYDFCKSL